jgi:hypothetical protein
MKVKRTAENQIAKDNYDDDRHASGEDVSLLMHEWYHVLL